MKNAVIYARYSSSKQNGQSIEDQLKECYEFAEREGYNVIDKYIDQATSGTSDAGRHQFLKMIDDSKNKLFSFIIVYQLDRFARNKYDSAIYKRKLKINGVKVLSARERISDDASGILMESVLEGMAEYYSVELGQKTTRGLNSNAEHCYFNGGTVPLGYKTVEIDSVFTDKPGNPIKKKVLVIDEETEPLVKKVFEMYNSNNTMADIEHYLNSQNYKTSRGNEFNKNSIRRILTDKRYIGIYSYNGIEKKDGVPRIIDDETFYKVDDIINVNRKAPARKRAKTDYLLTTKIFCGDCGESMVGYSGKTRNGEPLYKYYACKNYIKHKCKKKAINKDKIENLVIDYIQSILTDEYIQKIATMVVDLIKKQQEDSSNIKRLEKALKDNEKSTKNLLDSLAKCDNDDVRNVIFNQIAKNEEIKNQTLLNIKIEEANNIRITVTQVKFFLMQLKKDKKCDITYKKALIKTLIQSIYVYDDYVLIVCNTQDKREIKISVDDAQSSFKETNGSPNSNNPLFIKGFYLL